jgi:hypothetical protein
MGVKLGLSAYRKKYRQRMFHKNKVQRRILGTKKEEVMG